MTTLKKRGLYVVKKIILIISSLILAVGIYIVYTVHSDLGQMEIDTDNVIHRAPITEQTEEQPDKKKIEKEEETDENSNFYTLITGIDLRDGQLMLNTDSIIVAHILPEQAAVKLVSLPRDTKVKNSQGQDVKINSIFSEGYMHAVRESRKDPKLLSGKKVKMGGVKIAEEYISSGMVELRTAVESFLEIDIDYMFLVNFDTVVSLVDAVGGIEVDVDRSMRYEAPSENTYIHLDAGRQILDGEQALNFARFRLDSRGSAYDSNDFERGVRQQQVIMALADRLASWNSLPKALNLIDIVTANVKTDMSRSTMASLLRQFYGKIDSEHIITIPFEGYWQHPYVLISDQDLRELKRNLHAIDINEPS